MPAKTKVNEFDKDPKTRRAKSLKVGSVSLDYGTAGFTREWLRRGLERTAEMVIITSMLRHGQYGLKICKLLELKLTIPSKSLHLTDAHVEPCKYCYYRKSKERACDCQQVWC